MSRQAATDQPNRTDELTAASFYTHAIYINFGLA
jgi:hypothetical protein